MAEQTITRSKYGYGVTGSWADYPSGNQYSSSRNMAGNPTPARSAIPLYPEKPVQQFQPMDKQPNPSVAQPAVDPYAGVLSVYEQMSANWERDKPKGAPVVTIGAPPQDQGAGDSWRNRIYAERAANSRPSTGYQSGPKTVDPQKQAIPYPTAPEYKPPEYAPPAADPNAYKNARREAIAPGLRELREGTREAISSAQSLDNPNARANFISQALKGYGRGLESVAAGAAREARGVESQKRQEQLDLYKSQYDVKNRAYLENYHNQITKMATDFATQVSTGVNPMTGKAGSGLSMSQQAKQLVSQYRR